MKVSPVVAQNPSDSILGAAPFMPRLGGGAIWYKTGQSGQKLSTLS